MTNRIEDTFAVLEAEAGGARCPSLNYQQILDGDGDRPAGPWMEESYSFLGDEDISYERYTSQAYYDLEMERLWTRTWQWACRKEHIPEVGDYYVYDVGRYSILIVHSHEGIKAYHNSCPHRATKFRPSGSDGSAGEIRCPYHGWTWTLEGDLSRLPCAWDFPHVKPDQFRLPEVKADIWAGFIFINMDPDAPPLMDYLGILPEHAAQYWMKDRYTVLHVQKELACNWKLTLDASQEAYHVEETHPQTLVANNGDASQYDFFGPHISRIFKPNGLTSPAITRPVSEQERADAIVAGDPRDDSRARVIVREGETARHALARYFRETLGIPDTANVSTAELVDSQGYFVFPNAQFFFSGTRPVAARALPLNNRFDQSLWEFFVLRPLEPGEDAPIAPAPVRLKEDEPFTSLPDISFALAEIQEQDTSNLRAQQEGMMAGPKPGQTLGNYQEVRIRHMHRTLDAYVATPPGESVDLPD